MTAKLVFIICLLALFRLASTSLEWWSLGVSECARSGGNSCENCDTLMSNGVLTSNQADSCSKNVESVQAMAQGTRDAILACQNQFANSLWNCTTFDGRYLFGSFINTGHTRETAVLFSYLTAGATQAISEGCRTQKIEECPCTGAAPRKEDEKGHIIFTDCGDNINWATEYIKNFLSINSSVSVGEKCDQQNINIGTKAVSNTGRVCRCHGLSGACTVQTCYQRAPVVSEVGESLFTKYGGAVQVTLMDGELKRLIDIPNVDPLKETDICYVDPSPNFCEPDPSKGVPGTVGRICDINSNSVNSCNVLCCGRGYSTRTYTVPIEECEFVFCCRIECRIVRNDTIVEYRCN